MTPTPTLDLDALIEQARKSLAAACLELPYEAWRHHAGAITPLIAKCRELQEEVVLSTAQTLRVMMRLAAAQERIRELSETLDWVLNDVTEWCDQVAESTAWDSWDHCYKSFQFGGIEKARNVLTATKEPSHD